MSQSWLTPLLCLSRRHLPPLTGHLDPLPALARKQPLMPISAAGDILSGVVAYYLLLVNLIDRSALASETCYMRENGISVTAQRRTVYEA